MDIKVTACESLINDISKLESWSYLDDLVSSTKLLENFESSLDMLQATLSKKLKRESMDSSGSSQNGSSHRDSNAPSINRMDSSGSKKTQSFMSWGTKFTKSVERMNAFSLTKT
jgi:hypothetical protein